MELDQSPGKGPWLDRSYGSTQKVLHATTAKLEVDWQPRTTTVRKSRNHLRASEAGGLPQTETEPEEEGSMQDGNENLGIRQGYLSSRTGLTGSL